ncbi:molybdopterin-guanine dinucleotide biosynthesis protein A [Psychrobacter luti]|uniref:Molybdopterin-guanine dinucleotide biosynthesis protein A n=1 Tax=Psychrobacter luti TaxID=198481 RepID=A0A839TD25_9GAMM|nr:NTP transferase domain-containing protein [Psychrobacter luti]MBB3106336.1 molybdopterin-guanine dinucleotide biosynthesis protein A [Psychrobacter luti]
MLKVADSLIQTDELSRLAGIVILAGGASKRMGSPKAELILPTGERLLDYHVRQALELSTAMISNIAIMIADNGRGFSITPDLLKKNPQSLVFHLTDYLSANGFSNKILSSNDNKPIETGGALVAIEAALQSLKSLVSSNQLTKDASWQQSWLMVISCDSLIPVTDLWQKLQPYITQAADKSVICLTDNSNLYPLLGLYRLSIEPDLKRYIDDGQRQVMKFIKPIMQPVPFAKAWQDLTNFNTPDAFECACTALRDI